MQTIKKKSTIKGDFGKLLLYKGSRTIM